MVFASEINSTNIEKYFPSARFGNIGAIMDVLTPVLIIGGSFLFLAMLVFGAYKYISAGGTKENVESARKIFSYAIIGIILVITAFLIVKVISIMAGVKFIL